MACAIAAGCTELILALIIGLPMLGGMMGNYDGMMRHGYGVGIVWWLGGAVVSALAGAVFAGIYNIVNR